MPEADSANAVIINEMLYKQLGSQVLHASITLDGTAWKVVGVVADFNLQDITGSNRIEPTLLKLTPATNYRYAAVQVAGRPEDDRHTVEALWYAAFPDELYRGFVQAEVMDHVNRINEMMIKIGSFLGIVAILISVLGLYTLIALKVQRRSKEFGIRKVLGAPFTTIVKLLSRELYLILAIAAVVGMVFSYLQNRTFYAAVYAYYLDVAPHHFVLPIVTVLAIVLLAVGYKMVQTGKMDPVKQLRAE